jgi:hypothetical protein
MKEALATAWPTIQLIMWTGMGAFVLYALNRLNSHQPFSLFKVLNINVDSQANSRTILGDMVVSSVLGAIVVFSLTSPETSRQAIAAGLGMTGILSAAAKKE